MAEAEQLPSELAACPPAALEVRRSPPFSSPYPSATTRFISSFPVFHFRFVPRMQAYVQRRIRQFNSLPQLRQHLGDHAATSLETATLTLLATGCGGPAAQAGRAPPPAGPAKLALVFRHDCR